MKRFCIHDWSAWSDPIQVYEGNKQQWRYCLKCNKVIFRTIMGAVIPEYKSAIGNVISALKSIPRGGQ